MVECAISVVSTGGNEDLPQREYRNWREEEGGEGGHGGPGRGGRTGLQPIGSRHEGRLTVSRGGGAYPLASRSFLVSSTSTGQKSRSTVQAT